MASMVSPGSFDICSCWCCRASSAGGRILVSASPFSDPVLTEVRMARLTTDPKRDAARDPRTLLATNNRTRHVTSAELRTSGSTLCQHKGEEGPLVENV